MAHEININLLWLVHVRKVYGLLYMVCGPRRPAGSISPLSGARVKECLFAWSFVSLFIDDRYTFCLTLMS